MNIYEVSTGCYSDKAHQIIVHEKYYSPEEFKELCKSVTESIVRKDDYLSNEDEVVKVLIEKHGFKRPKIVSCHFWDYSYNDEDDIDNQFQASESSEE